MGCMEGLIHIRSLQHPLFTRTLFTDLEAIKDGSLFQACLESIIIINILFVPQYKTEQLHKLQINLDSAVWRLKFRKREKVE